MTLLCLTLKKEKQDQGHDELVNGPIEEYLGSRVFTPRDLNETYGGVWPTIRQLRKVTFPSRLILETFINFPDTL